jgi:hypothetical protein
MTGCSAGSASPTVTVTEETTYVPEPIVVDDDQVFLDSVRSYDNYFIATADDNDLIALALTVCDVLYEGYTVSEIIATLASEYSNESDDTYKGLGFIIGAGVAVYCPKYLNELQS